MTKIPFLLFCGWGHAASTPFYYTLADNMYCHGGHIKEPSYLPNMEQYEYFDRPMWEYNSDPYERILGPDTPNVPPELNHHSPYNDFPEEFIQDWIAEPPNIEKYIDYYLIHWRNVKHDYHAVADFSNCNGWLREPFLDKYIPKLEEYFDIKVIFVARDPVRRSYSDFSAKFTGNCNSSDWIKKGMFNPGMKMKKERYDSVGELFVEELNSSVETFHYVDFYRKFKKYVPTLQIVMEDFWEPNNFKEQTNTLSKFLDYPIVKIHENAFWPEAGENAPKYDFLKDQWGSVRKPLTKELYDYGREQLDPVYSQWEDEFGSLPSSWGHHI